MAWALLMVVASLSYVCATRAYLCSPPCVHGTCESENCSCVQGWAGPQCTQAINVDSCSTAPRNCSGFVTCSTTSPASCISATPSYVNVGNLGSNFSLSLQYSTVKCDGVLLHGEDGAFPGYYITLELRQGTMKLSTNCGEGEVVVQSIPENVSDPKSFCSGQWLSVKAIRTQYISYLEVTNGRTITVLMHADPPGECVAGNNVTFSIGSTKEQPLVDTSSDTIMDLQFIGYVRNVEIANFLRKWTLPHHIYVQHGTEGEGGANTPPQTRAVSNGGTIVWLCAALGGAGMLICICCIINLILACALCYQQRTRKGDNKKQPQQHKYPGSQLHLLPALDIKDNNFLDNIDDNPTAVTFTPVTGVPSQHIPYLQPHTLGYSQQNCCGRIPISLHDQDAQPQPLQT